MTLPHRAPRLEGLALLATHAEWVAARLAALPPAVPFAPGATITLNGRCLRILHRDGMSTPPRLHGQSLWVGGSLEALPLAVEAFLHSKAWAQFAGLVGQKSHALGFGPRRIVIKDLRSRWASCTKDRTLTFSWRLIMAPLWVQEHVAAHEVAHLRYMNHGPQFHALERELSRSGDAARAWLRRYGAGLLRVG